MHCASFSTIADLNLKLDIAHTWVGDVSVVLEHVDTGTSVTVIDRPGFPASTNGCSRDNIVATLDDDLGRGLLSQQAQLWQRADL